MDFVFDAPMPLHEVQEIVRRGFFRQTTRDAIGVLVSERLAREVGRCAFDPKTLFDARKPPVAAQYRANPYLSLLNPAMTFLDCLGLRGENPSSSG